MLTPVSTHAYKYLVNNNTPFALVAVIAAAAAIIVVI
jgi:hypothetical protein